MATINDMLEKRTIADKLENVEEELHNIVNRLYDNHRVLADGQDPNVILHTPVSAILDLVDAIRDLNTELTTISSRLIYDGDNLAEQVWNVAHQIELATAAQAIEWARLQAKLDAIATSTATTATSTAATATSTSAAAGLQETWFPLIYAAILVPGLNAGKTPEEIAEDVHKFIAVLGSKHVP